MNASMYLNPKINRPEHSPLGDPCQLCGLPGMMHRVRAPRPEHEYEGRGPLCGRCNQPFQRHRARESRKGVQGVQKNKQKRFIGIDGEGQDWIPHRYVMLAASDEYGIDNWVSSNPKGLSTVECLDFILQIPNDTRLFAYGFNYDLTKILQDLPNEALYFLFRPELRKEKRRKRFGLRPVVWGPYKLNLQGTKFTVSAFGRHKVIWDIWKFFQGKFVNALRLWKVGNKEMLDHMQYMKDKRHEFDKESRDKVLAYCLDECRCMAELAHKLVDAHTKAGLKLRTFYGAGSSAAAMLDVMKIKTKIYPPPEEMKRAIASSFFGGRFENSLIGTVKGPVHSYDISSAYPYQLCFLPCLEHSRWELVKSRKKLEKVKYALVKYRLERVPERLSWGPFPFRTSNGSICYPQESGGGWIWSDEFLAGEKLFPNVVFEEAWICHCECDCKPFERIPSYYNERCRLGKEGPGIVIKLGTNSCYGKLAQSVGNGVYNCWLWASMITSGCRAQGLTVMGLHKDISNMLMIATDGIQTREKLVTPIPFDTNTSETGKPLGGWEHKVIEQGVFYARPGIYFPLNPTSEDIDAIRARGIGKGTLLDHWERVIRSWEQKGTAGKVNLSTLTRFCGAKTSISRTGANTFRRSVNYGEWSLRPTDMTFDPKPKRERVLEGGLLEVRRMPLHLESRPYTRAVLSSEAEVLKALQVIQEEQPDF